MIEKVQSLQQKYPFWSGILIGFLACLIIIGIFSGSGGGKNGFHDAEQILKEDYLRMSILDYAYTKNDARATWRYGQLGDEGPSLLSLMKRDPITDPLELLNYAGTVSDYSLAAPELVQTQQKSGGTSALRVVFWIILILILAALIVLFTLSEKGKLFSRRLLQKFNRLRKRTPEGETDFQEAFDQETINRKSPFELFSEKISDVVAPLKKQPDEKDDEAIQFDPVSDDWISNESGQKSDHSAEIPADKTTESSSQDADDESLPPFLEVGMIPEYKEEREDPSELTDVDLISEVPQDETTPDIEDSIGSEVSPDDDIESILVDDLPDETLDSVPEVDLNAESLLAEAADEDLVEGEPFDISRDSMIVDEDEEDEIITDESLEDFHFSDDHDHSVLEPGEGLSAEKALESESGLQTNEPLIHYQTVYKLGDDFFDETFSLDDAEERFVGECGIGIAETINNSDPKAVTAFEIWLFDRDDVQTPTHFLLSEFAYSNEVMLERLKNKGRFDLIELNRPYEVNAQSLRMVVTVTDFEYGSGSSDRRSYFDMVAFDVKVWQV